MHMPQVAETNGGDGYDVYLPKATLSTLAPALRATIHALRSKLGCGRAVGLPLRHKANRTPVAIRRAEAAQVEALERSLPADKGPRMMSQVVGAVPKEAYQLLLTTIKTEDPELKRCGLTKLTAADGTTAWVRLGADSERFQEEGKRALGRVELAVPLQLIA